VNVPDHPDRRHITDPVPTEAPLKQGDAAGFPWLVLSGLVGAVCLLGGVLLLGRPSSTAPASKVFTASSSIPTTVTMVEYPHVSRADAQDMTAQVLEIAETRSPEELQFTVEAIQRNFGCVIADSVGPYTPEPGTEQREGYLREMVSERARREGLIPGYAELGDRHLWVAWRCAR
jgi:hypothetical protein